MRVADAVVDILRSEGVKFVAALPGDDILPLFDAFHQQNDIPLILTRHEQATVFMADGYARSCGEPGSGDGDERAGAMQCHDSYCKCFHGLCTPCRHLRS